MDEKKQIEEMARIICADSANKGLCEKCGFNKGCWKFKDAESIYNEGYRKQSDLIEEFADRLKKKLYDKQSIFTQQRYIVVDEIENLVSEMKGGAE